MTNSTNTATCLLCHVKLVKNGRNTAGNQRWKCPKCGASSTRKRDDRSRLFTLQRFLDWLLGKHTQADTKPGGTGRTFRHQIRWCWDLQPRITVTGEIHDVIQIDGFNLRTGWCVLVATSNNKIVAYQWCARESQAAWSWAVSSFVDTLFVDQAATATRGSLPRSYSRRTWRIAVSRSASPGIR